MFFSKNFVLAGEKGQELGSVVLEHLWADVDGLRLKKSGVQVPVENWLAQMKREGGKLYHGGTVATNTRMIRLFERHGCDLYRQMEELVYLAQGDLR